MDYRELNRIVMDDTQELCSKLTYLQNAIENSIKKEYIVYQEDSVEIENLEANKNMEIIVSKKRTLEAAEAYKDKKVCCLDFADNHLIGGLPWFAGTQEESLCRISTLYPCLYAKKKEFYDKHISEYESGLISNMGNDDLIYIPDVVVFKTDESAPKLKDENTWFKTDVIVSAAPLLYFPFDKREYLNILRARIKRILDVAAKENVEVLILGAYGCGAFYNPPETVSKIFSLLIGNYNFKTVEFAIFCREDSRNYDVFRQRFEKN